MQLLDCSLDQSIVNIHPDHELGFVEDGHHEGEVTLVTPDVKTAFSLKPVLFKHPNFWVLPPIFKRLKFEFVSVLELVPLM